MQMDRGKVVVIGFGPGGIAATRALLRKGIKPLVLEASPALGGLWNVDNRKMWQSVHTNLSHYTCSFVDKPWPPTSPLFPSASEVHQYLMEYVQQYIPIDCVQFNSSVIQVTQNSETNGYTVKWVNNTTNKEFVDIFEHVVVAVGFFAQSHIHSSLLNELTHFQGTILHSSQYRNADMFKDQVVAVIGGAFSGCELATEIAQSARRVHHVCPQDVFIVPRFLPEHTNNPKTAFLPLDMVFYQLSSQRMQELGSSFPCERVFKTDQENVQSWAYFQQLTSQHVTSNAAELGYRPRIAICDHYFTLVHAGAIQRALGRVQTISSPNTLYVATSSGEVGYEIAGVDAIVLCTGYKPKLSFLDVSILELLRFQPDDDYLPCDLVHDMYSPHLPGLFFVGFYRGPYFAALQAQAVIQKRVRLGFVSLLHCTGSHCSSYL